MGKAVQWNKYAPNAILKYNTSSVILKYNTSSVILKYNTSSVISTD